MKFVLALFCNLIRACVPHPRAKRRPDSGSSWLAHLWMIHGANHSQVIPE